MLDIVTGVDTDVLRKKTKRVSDPTTPEIQKLISEMFETMEKANGIGLAANQIGQSLALAVAEVEGERYCWINPELTSYSKEKILFEEGCLSLPNNYLDIVRSETVTLKYQNEKGLPKKLRASGLLAVVIQHELDHLQGTLIANRYAMQEKLRKRFERKEDSL